MKEETLAIVRRMQDNEATDQRVYAALAKQASLQKNSEILEKMSHDEGLHCAVWGRYTGIEAKADMFRVWLFVVLGKIFGLVFVINLMEGGEDDSAENYRKLMEELPEARSIMEDETRHEAQLMGVNVNATISLTFAIGSGLAAIAGVLFCSAYPTLTPYTGSMPGIKAFTAAVFGGIGSIPGALIGGILLGIIEILGRAYISSQLSDAIVFAVLIVVLLVKPTGILGKQIHEKV